MGRSGRWSHIEDMQNYKVVKDELGDGASGVD